MSSSSNAVPAPSYSLPLRGLHWLIAVLALVAVCGGLIALALPPGDLRGAVLMAHKSLGVTVFALALLRILVRLIEKAPEYTPKLSAFNHALAGLVHLVLYATLIALPLSGFVHSQAGKHAVSWFGLYTLPNLIPANEGLAEASGQAHMALAFTLGAALVLHLAGAAWHAWVKKDTVFTRMWPSWKP